MKNQLQKKRKYNNLEDIKDHKDEIAKEFDGDLPDYLHDYFDDEILKMKKNQFFEEKRRLKYSTTLEEKKEYYKDLKKEFWENNDFEIIKKKRRIGSHLEPVWEEPNRNEQRLEDERDLTEDEIKILIAMCETDLYLFAIRYFSHFLKKPSSRFHKYIYGFLSENTNNRKKHSRGFKHAIASPRGSAKSSIISAIYPIWCIAYNKKKFIIIVSDTAGQAIDFLSDIKREIENNALLLRDFPHLNGKGNIWRADEIITKNDIKLLALGTGSKIRGRRYGVSRPDLLIFDDIENADMLRSESERNHIRYEWFNKEALHVYGEKGTYTDFLFVGTILGKTSLLYAVLDPQEYPDWTGKIFKSVYKFSEADELWEEWEELYKNRFDEERIHTARKFFEDHKEEMLEDTEVLWPEGDPYYDLMISKISDISAFYCFKQGTPILIENHKQTPIESIKEGDKVLSENGEYEIVTYVSERKSNSKIVKLKIAGVPDIIEVTEEHPFLVWPLIKYQNRSLTHNYLYKESSINKTKQRQSSINYRILENKSIWKLAKDLKIGDSLIQPIYNKNYNFDSKDEDWWWLVGYYLAEGYINYLNYSVVFTANRNEEKFFHNVIRICKKLNFGKAYNIYGSRTSKKCIHLTVCSKELADSLKEFGRYSHGKFLSNEVYDICFDNFNALWSGYFSGDGFIIDRGRSKYQAVNSVSKSLLIDFKNLWAKFGTVSYLYKSRKAGIGEIRGIKFKAKQLWSLQLVGKDRGSTRELQSWIYKNKLYSRVQRIDIEDQGTNIVYGLSVTGNKTYCIPSAVVHNSEKQNNPLDPSKIIITLEELRFENFNLSPWRDMIDNKRNPIYGALDPSLGKNQKKGDPSCICTIIKDIKTGYILIFSFSLKRRIVDKQIYDILLSHKNMFKSYGRGYTLFSVESNIFQLVVAQNLRKAARETGIYVPIHEAIVKNDKKARFEKHVPLMRDGTIIFNRGSYNNSVQYNKAVEQISTFVGDGSDAEDDAVDGASLALDLVTAPKFKLRTKQAK